MTVVVDVDVVVAELLGGSVQKLQNISDKDKSYMVVNANAVDVVEKKQRLRKLGTMETVHTKSIHLYHSEVQRGTNCNPCSVGGFLSFSF